MRVIIAIVLLAAPVLAECEPLSRIGLLPAETYTRTTKGPSSFTRAFDLPAGLSAKDITAYLTVGNESLSSGSISLNGIAVFGPNDFNETVVRLRKQVALEQTNALVVDFASKPGGSWTIDIEGSIREALVLESLRQRAGTGVFFERTFTGVAEVTANFTVPVTTGRFDLVMTNGLGLERVTAARVLLNDVEVMRPNHFNETVDVFTAPVVVRDTNILSVRIQSGEAHSFTLTLKGFVPDAQPPVLRIDAPLAGECAAADTLARLSYSDQITGANPATLRAFIGTQEITGQLMPGVGATTWRLGVLLPEIPQSREVTLTIIDRRIYKAA